MPYLAATLMTLTTDNQERRPTAQCDQHDSRIRTLWFCAVEAAVGEGTESPLILVFPLSFSLCLLTAISGSSAATSAAVGWLGFGGERLSAAQASFSSQRLKKTSGLPSLVHAASSSFDVLVETVASIFFRFEESSVNLEFVFGEPFGSLQGDPVLAISSTRSWFAP